MIEVAFFFAGVIPYWWALWTPEKDPKFWLVMGWCCLVWIIYMAWHAAYVGVLHNVVELGIVLHGMRRFRF